MIRTVSTVPDCWKSSRRSSSVAWKERFPTNSFAAIARPPSPSKSGRNRTLLPGSLPVVAQGYMTTGDACQGGQKSMRSQINSAGPPAANGNANAGNDRGARRYQEAHEIGDVLRGRDAFERVVTRSLGTLRLAGLARRCGLLGDETLPARGGGRGGRHGRDENVRGGAEIGQSLREVYEPGVGDTSREVAWGRVARGGTDDVDDASATLRLHDREDGPGHPNVAEDLQAPVPRPLLVGDLQEVSTPDGARVVDEDVESTEAIPHRGGNTVHFVQSAQIAGDDEDLGARLRLDLLCGFLESRLVARADRDLRALSTEAERDRPPDSLASTRHQRRLAGQFKIHEVSFLTFTSTSLGKAGAARQSK